MRVTQSMYYKNISANDNKINHQLFNVNKQIASGLKIQYSHEDPETFINTIRLDNEVTTLQQVKKSSDNGLKFSTNTDTSIMEMTKALTTFKTKLVQASNDTQSPESRDAIAKELDGLKQHLMNLANTSVNGKFIFSGSAVDTKPIDINGKYHGNDAKLESMLGNGIYQAYNIAGSDLFRGEESSRSRQIMTNMPNLNQTKLYPDIMEDPAIPRSTGEELYITANDTVRDLMGDNDAVVLPGDQNHFFVSGRRSDGTVVNSKISIDVDSKVGDLLDRIGDLYGNTNTSKVVNVEMNNQGQIVITDRLNGSSQMQFHMVGMHANVADVATLMQSGQPYKVFTDSALEPTRGYTDTIRSFMNMADQNLVHLPTQLYNGDGTIATASSQLADVFEYSAYAATGTITFNGTGTAGAVASGPLGGIATVNDLLTAIEAQYGPNVVAEFKEGKITVVDTSGTVPTALDIQMSVADGGVPINVFAPEPGVVYDGNYLVKDGATLTGDIPQIVRSDNAIATASTKIYDVAGIDTLGVNLLDTSTLTFEGFDVFGNDLNSTVGTSSIAFAAAGSSFTLTNGTTYNIYDAVFDDVNQNGVWDGGEATTQTSSDTMTYQQLFDVTAIIATGTIPAGNTYQDYQDAVEAAKILVDVGLDENGKIYARDRNSSATVMELAMTSSNKSLTFNGNSALTVSDPKTDFFADIEEAINAVRRYSNYPDGTDNDPRNIGIHGSITKIDELLLHATNMNTEAGANSTALQSATDRAQMLTVNTKKLRSEYIDTDITEASLQLQQLTLNYQAMLSTVSRVSQLSLVNYL